MASQQHLTGDVTRREVFRTSGRVIAMCVGLFSAVAPTCVATASEYPEKIIKLIVPAAAGGPTDVFARVLADGLTAELGRSVVVENRTGAGGVTAYAATASAAPDGYTLVVVDPSITILPSLHDKLPYDVEKDLVPISLFVRGTTVLIARKSLEAKDPVELVALAKREPGTLTYGSAGNGSFPHLNAELFKHANGIDMRHVPYRGGAPALVDLVGERIDLFFANVGTAKPYVDDGSIKALAIGGKRRSAMLPNVPTYNEAKLPMPQFDLGAWWGIMAPAKIPANIQAKLNQAVGKALKHPQLLTRFGEMSADALPSTPKEFSELIVAERSKWANVIRQANVKPE